MEELKPSKKAIRSQRCQRRKFLGSQELKPSRGQRRSLSTKELRPSQEQRTPRRTRELRPSQRVLHSPRRQKERTRLTSW